MNVVQLTFIVAINMMGSGIMMLPANMAQVGAISLLSWAVTALGSLAIAWGLAQAGLFNERPGGMAAYAEDAYGKAGYFQVFYLYFFSLLVANVAIAIAAVGYLSPFLPWLSSTPAATCGGAIALLWLATLANAGGPRLTGRIGSVTIWGVILPVGLLSVGGWIWFHPATFAAAWNPKGVTLGAGMRAAITLTVWAFLGLESAAQNSSVVENPKRTVPLACMLGTLGAAAIYVLSTTVIQGIVPNAELAASTAPFGVAYAHILGPTAGSLVMALAVVACVGSLAAWQFTLAETSKSAADDRLLPPLFARTTRHGAPTVGLCAFTAMQSILTLMTASPSLSAQFGVLVDLAVVTNVIPYIIALSALPAIMIAAGVERPAYLRHVSIAVAGMAFSIYAVYASGPTAIAGGLLVAASGYVVWRLIGSRATRRARAAAGRVA
jgi:putrescine:ornithine antiporter